MEVIGGRIVRPPAPDLDAPIWTRILEAEAVNREFAMNWRALFAPGAEGLRLTAQLAVEDWLEADA